MPDIPCRIARLESQVKSESEDNDDFRKEVKQSIDKLNDTLVKMEIRQEKQLSFIGGISTAIGGTIGLVGFVVNKYF